MACERGCWMALGGVVLACGTSMWYWHVIPACGTSMWYRHVVLACLEAAPVSAGAGWQGGVWCLLCLGVKRCGARFEGCGEGLGWEACASSWQAASP